MVREHATHEAHAVTRSASWSVVGRRDTTLVQEERDSRCTVCPLSPRVGGGPRCARTTLTENRESRLLLALCSLQQRRARGVASDPGAAHSPLATRHSPLATRPRTVAQLVEREAPPCRSLARSSGPKVQGYLTFEVARSSRAGPPSFAKHTSGAYGQQPRAAGSRSSSEALERDAVVRSPIAR